MKKPTTAMNFTGERFTPECIREIWYEHWHRYVFAHALARGKRVLDAACGEGYGSFLLADAAASVIGVDIAQDAIAHAQSRYGGRTNLSFLRRDCTALDLADASVDLVVSFETLEHVAAQDQLIAGFARVLAEDGILMVSSPDKHAYSDISGFHNEYHVRELYRDELLALLKPHFPHLRLYGQKLLFQSAIWALESAPRRVDAATAAGEERQSQTGLNYDPLYFIAVCSRQPLPQIADLALFGDREESVYQHYNGEVRRNMTAGARIAELEGEIAALRLQARGPISTPDAKPSAALPWWRRWLSKTRQSR